MPVLEQLEERMLLAAASSAPPGVVAELVQPDSALNQALDAYELAGGGKGLRQSLDSLAGQVRGWQDEILGVLDPGRSALMWAQLQDYISSPQPILVNPGSAAAPRTPPVYFVNGIRTTHDEAIAEARALADHLGRPVALLYNPTTGLLGDVTRTLSDLVWFPPLPQPDPVARQLAGVLLSAWEAGQPVDVVGYSEGAVIANNALRTLYALELGGWTYSDVALVSVGAPLGPWQAAGTARFERIDNVGDPVAEFLGDRRGSLIAKLAPPADSLRGLLQLHAFLPSYLSQISAAVLY
jgi:hypothetical protein